jgi:hypothetical protein
MVAEGPDAVRAQVRDWLSALLAGEQAEVALDEPGEWSNWDERLRR